MIDIAREEQEKTAMNPILEVTGFIDVELEYDGKKIYITFVEGMTDKYQRVVLDVTSELIEDICKIFESKGVKTKIRKTKNGE